MRIVLAFDPRVRHKVSRADFQFYVVIFNESRHVDQELRLTFYRGLLQNGQVFALLLKSSARSNHRVWNLLAASLQTQVAQIGTRMLPDSLVDYHEVLSCLGSLHWTLVLGMRARRSCEKQQ